MAAERSAWTQDTDNPFKKPPPGDDDSSKKVQAYDFLSEDRTGSPKINSGRFTCFTKTSHAAWRRVFQRTCALT